MARSLILGIVFVVPAGALACQVILGYQPGHLAQDAGGDVRLDGGGSVDHGDAPGDSPGDGHVDATPDGATDEQSGADAWQAALASSLVLWLKGDVGVTTAACGSEMCVTGWTDQSTQKNDAVVPLG